MKLLHNNKKLLYHIDSKPKEKALLITTSNEVRIGDWYNDIWRIDGDNEYRYDKDISRWVSGYKEDDIEGWISIAEIIKNTKITNSKP